jgi:pimeloyl-ACP methyl ester carboxylesterase/molybdopterin/thiamine biosynthesis adenylyltransferase
MDEALYRDSFSRNIGILTQAEQERLAHSTVAIAGLGGIGGSTLVTLARMGVGGFRIADFDKFEHVNINRQYGARADTCGVPKCEVLEEEIRRINPSVRIETFPQGFTPATADAILQGADAVVDAIDFYAIEEHLALHRMARAHGRFIFMGSPVGFSACLQIFDPAGMSLEEYCAIEPGMPAVEKQLRYACGLVPELAHIEYFDVSAGASQTDFLARTGPSIASACQLAASLVAMEVVLLLLNRRPARAIPHTLQFDPYTYRFENVFLPGGMRDYDPRAAIARIPDKSSLVAQVLNHFYNKPKAPKCKTADAEIAYTVEGSGEALLFISPLGADSGFWARNAPLLSKNFRVITFDNRGSGRSTGNLDQLSTETMAGDARALLDHLGIEKAHVVGLALGGLVATQLAHLHPERIHSLVLASSYAHADDHLSNVTEHWRQLAQSQGMEALFDECVGWLFSDEQLARRIDVNQLKTFYRLTLQQVRAFVVQSLAGITHDSRVWLSTIKAPTLILSGTADKLVRPQHAEFLARSLTNSRLLELDGAPHFFHWECADRFNRELLLFQEQLQPVVQEIV